jgi:hypothetical protein
MAFPFRRRGAGLDTTGRDALVAPSLASVTKCLPLQKQDPFHPFHNRTDDSDNFGNSHTHELVK